MRLHLTLLCALALTACNAFSDSPAEEEGNDGRLPNASSGFGVSGGNPGFAGPGVPGGINGTSFGPVVTSDVPPVPIQGGTLLVMQDGHTAVAADPDRDRVLIADLKDGEVLATLDLRPGDEPGRLVEDASGRVHIVLRRTGVIATLDVASRALVDRRDVCLAPQGIAYAKNSDTLLVACAEGDLVELPAAGGARSRVVRVDADLRDVMVSGNRVLVSRFKSAELLELGSDLQAARRSRAAEITGPFSSAFSGIAPLPPVDNPKGVEARTFSAGVAYRTLADANGQVVMLHQRSQSSEIDLQDEGDPHDPNSGGSAGTGAPSENFEDASAGGDPYGGGAGDLCGSIVRPALSAEQNGVMVSGPVLPAATLAVDAAFSPNGKWVAVGVAGSPDVSQKTFGTLSRVSAIVMPMDTVMATQTAEGELGSCPAPGLDGTPGSVLATGQVVSVAFDGDNRLVMQTREPSELHIIANFDGCVNCGADTVIAFGGESRLDTGHDLFHSDAGSSIACASCHPGGADDGHTWVFSGQGPRRTQLFNMGIEKTLPLHWDGTLATFSDLVSEVFVRRMGGAELGVSQVQAMEGWMDTLEPGTPLRLATDPAVVRGKALFESDAAQCASCHSGSMFTNNMTVDVGTGAALQVPSLIGVAHHAPWIHTGCATTLRDRFDPACGGDKHGNVAGLDDGQIDDLVAYLESL